MFRRGFTLIELIMVIVILGILAAVAIPQYVNLTAQARTGAAQGAVGAIRAAVAVDYARSAIGGGVAAYPAIGALGALFTDGLVPQNPLPPASRAVVAVYDGTGGWVYNAANGTVTSNDTAATVL